MSSAEASTHKRKASPSERSSPSSSQQHESKKPRKSEVQHTDDCEDPDCEGCAEGEIILQFDTKPGAVELFQMAREEMASGSSGSSSESGSAKLSRMAKALFDKAIEEFEVLDKANAHIELNDGTGVALQVVETKIQHAACVITMGNNIPSLEMLQEGTSMFGDLAKKTANENGNVLVGLGIAEISQVMGQRNEDGIGVFIKDEKIMARELRRQAMKALEPEDDDDDGPSEEQRDVAALVGKPEAKLVNSGIENFIKGLTLLKNSAKSESAFAQESTRAAQELEEYGIALDSNLNSELATKIFDHAIQHLENAKASLPSLFESNADVLSLYGSCLYSKAKLVNNQEGGDENVAKQFVEKAIETLTKAEVMQREKGDAKTLETLGQVYLMSIDLIGDDDDLVMERIDAAKEKLSRALELDPDNYALEEQVEALRGDDDEEGFDEDQSVEDEDEGAED
ncbi:hypothetical protein BGX21_007233 [Mortierella sp. AD011]|nr:hypothetical protein BGX20_001346 [Mortierella sp. AD010]KAF9403075.1 hypothetical protein BGX21_007233 [Mortierella sp. AD011]